VRQERRLQFHLQGLGTTRSGDKLQIYQNRSGGTNHQATRWSFLSIEATFPMAQLLILVVVAQTDQTHCPSCPVKRSDSAVHSLSFSGLVIAICHIPALAADSRQHLSYTKAPAVTPSRCTLWYRKNCCADGATGLFNCIIWAIIPWCAKPIKTIAHLSSRAWSRTPFGL